VIAKRLRLEEFYEARVLAMLNDEKYLDKEKMKRMKAILANSDAIFDSGFIDFVSTVHERGNGQGGRLFVYEYLHENNANTGTYLPFKKYLKDEFLMSTHFDGIDFSFGKFRDG